MFTRRALAALLLPIFLLTLLMAAGCGSKEVPPVDPNAVKKELFGKVWNCQSLFGREVVGEQKLTLEFLPDGTVKGNGGCNDFSGTYALAGESLTFGPFQQTEKACGAATGEQEYTYLVFLGKVKKLSIEDDELKLFSDNGVKPMLFTTGSSGFLW